MLTTTSKHPDYFSEQFKLRISQMLAPTTETIIYILPIKFNLAFHSDVSEIDPQSMHSSREVLLHWSDILRVSIAL